MKKYLADYAFLFTLSGLIILLDQWSKYMIRTHLTMGEVFMPGFWLSQYARLVYWKNTGAAFGMFQRFGDVFMILSFVVGAAILYYFPRVPRQEWLLRLAMILQFAGAVGNLIDRLTRGYVTDFISVGNFAVFNVADASISTGVAVLVLDLWLKDRQEKAQKVKKLAESDLAALDASPETLIPGKQPGDLVEETPEPAVPQTETHSPPEESQGG